MAVAGLVIGIISLVLAGMSWLPCMGWSSWFLWFVPIPGLIVSIIGQRQCANAGQPSGMAIAGIVLSIIAFIGLCIRAVISIFTLGI